MGTLVQRFKLHVLTFFSHCRFQSFADQLHTTKWVAFHNNWIRGSAAKRYKLKEYKMWEVNPNGYYSNDIEQYLTYSNPINFGADHTRREEEFALRNALFLGILLNRVVILPKFHCYITTKNRGKLVKTRVENCSCSENFDVQRLDEHADYREQVFLDHPKVPLNVKVSRTSPIFVDLFGSVQPEVDFSRYKDTFSQAHIKFTFDHNKSASMNIHALLKFFVQFSKLRVLEFHSLYGNLLPQVGNMYKYHKGKVDKAVQRII